MNEIKLGSAVQTKVSGFTGTVTAKVEYLDGFTQWEVTGKAVDGKSGEVIWYRGTELSLLD